MPERPSEDEVLLRVARDFAARSTCSRGQTGAVLAIRGRIISTGYNGAPANMSHCEHVSGDEGEYEVTTGRYLRPGEGCPVSVHAEANAVAFAARHGVALDGSALYTTMTPCVPCAQLIINVGVVRVVALRWYRERRGWELLDRRGIQLEITELAEHHASGCPGNDPYPCTCGAMT